MGGLAVFTASRRSLAMQVGYALLGHLPGYIWMHWPGPSHVLALAR